MNSIYDFIIEPFGERYNNKSGKLIVNTDMSDHRFVNRTGRVIYTPIAVKSNIKEGDLVIVHHNVFRRMHNIKSKEVNSRSFLDENKYFVNPSQVFAYNDGKEWRPTEDFVFVKPIKNRSKFNVEPTEELKGLVAMDGNGFKKNDLVGFAPSSEYEFTIENTLMYRVLKKFITIKYEREGNEEAYNPSWA
jgi:hypothetical protein